MTRLQYDCLFISPHIDDVVLSCALRLLKERQLGKTILVVTIFSEAIKLLPGLDLYRDRKNEDEKALKILGINDHLWRNFCDAPFRNFFYRSFGRIVLNRHPKDDLWLGKIAENIKLLCQKYKSKTVFLPLAVGNHIDHRLTHQIWTDLPKNINIIFYEDRPYTFLPHNLESRLTEIGATNKELLFGNQNKTEKLKSLTEGLNNLTFYKSITNKKERLNYLLWATKQLNTTPTDIELKPKLNLEAELIDTTEKKDIESIEQAIFAYKSQIPMLYKNIEIFRQESSIYSQSIGSSSTYAERYWKLVR